MALAVVMDQGSEGAATNGGDSAANRQRQDGVRHQRYKVGRFTVVARYRDDGRGELPIRAFIHGPRLHAVVRGANSLLSALIAAEALNRANIID